MALPLKGPPPLAEGVHIVGLSVLSGSRIPLVKEILRRLREQGTGEIPVVVGGIIPKELLAAGVAGVYTPMDYKIQDTIADLVDITVGYQRAALGLSSIPLAGCGNSG